METYGNLAAVAAAPPAELADRCGVSETAARAVHAAAQLALEDQSAAKARLKAQGARSRSRSAAGTYPVDEAVSLLAAEASREDYPGEPEQPSGSKGEKRG
jgi:excinuclease ABC subunit C